MGWVGLGRAVTGTFGEWGVGSGVSGQRCAGVRLAPCASTSVHTLPQVWSRQYPHQHALTPSNEPLASLTRNFCRNPEESEAADGVRSRAPWCAVWSEQLVISSSRRVRSLAP